MLLDHNGLRVSASNRRIVIVDEDCPGGPGDEFTLGVVPRPGRKHAGKPVEVKSPSLPLPIPPLIPSEAESEDDAPGLLDDTDVELSEDSSSPSSEEENILHTKDFLI